MCRGAEAAGLRTLLQCPHYGYSDLSHLDPLLENIAASIDQTFVTPGTLKRLCHFLIFALAILGVLKEKKHRTRLSLASLGNLIVTSLVDVSFAILGMLLDYLALRIGKKKFCFTALLIPSGNRSGNRSGILRGWLMDVLLRSGNVRSFVFRSAFLLPTLGTPATLWVMDEAVPELMVDPVWLGVPIASYIVVWWIGHDPGAFLSLLSTM